MNETRRLLWVSDNEKYKVLVRKLPDVESPVVGFWKLDKYGRNKDVRFTDLPNYVKEKIEEMKNMLRTSSS